MKTEDWLNQGKLEEAIAQARKDVSNAPENTSLQFFLFQLLAITEDFDSAENELHQVETADASLSEGVGFYLGIIKAERLRHSLLTEGRGEPQSLIEPPEYSSKFLNALRLLCESKVEEAEVQLSEGWRDVPKVSGTIDGDEFAEIRDADDVLGPFLEALIPGSYFWIPFEQIQRIEFKNRRGYQDTIWMPAYLEMKGEIQAYVWIPSLYSGTGNKEDILRLGELTSWEYPSANIARVSGQRDIVTDKITKGIRQVSTIVFDKS